MGHLSKLGDDEADKKIIKTLRCHPLAVIIDKKLVTTTFLSGQDFETTIKNLILKNLRAEQMKFSQHTRRNWVGLCCHGMRKSIHILSGVKISSLLASWTGANKTKIKHWLAWKSGNDEQEQSFTEVHQLRDFPGQTFSRKQNVGDKKRWS